MIGSVKTNLFILFCLLSCYCAKSNEITRNYIEQYKTIAVIEMNRVKIPASIKMAQAILESASGMSTLARQSNNHFGIKCGNAWRGQTVYRHDDDYENGLLVRSCFRAYGDPAESFYAHSDFLANPKSKRYRFLFDLDIKDYKAWAHGLKKAGYATDKEYPKRLIEIIEKYQLYTLDYTNENSDEEILVHVSTVDRDQNIFEDPHVELTGNVIDKKSDRSSFGNSYIVKRGDSMASIAYEYHIDVKDFYFRNRMPYGSEPGTGEKLLLKGYLHFRKKPRLLLDKQSTEKKPQFLFEETISISSE